MHFHVLTLLMMVAAVAAQTTQIVTTSAAATNTVSSSSLPPTAASSSMVQPSETPGPMAGNQTIVEILASPNNTNASAISQIAQNLGQNNTLIQALNSTGNYTVFVPSNNAVSSANMTLINETYGGWENVLAYHVVNQSIPFENLTTLPMFFNTVLTNSTLSKFPNGTGLPIGLVRNITPGSNILAGWIHDVTDGTGNNGSLEIGYGYDQYGNLQNQNITASNGIIVLIDKVLLPPVSPVQTLSKKNSVSMIVQAINQHNLTDSINNATGITFFAPNDQAIQAANLTQYDNATLAAILKNHVVQGVFFTSNITANSTLTTLTGGNLTFANTTMNSSTNGGNEQHYAWLKRLFTQDSGTEYSVGNATIVDKNVLTNNGVIHIISKVLIPQNLTSNGTNGNGTNNGTAPGSVAAITGTSYTSLVIALIVSLLLI